MEAIKDRYIFSNEIKVNDRITNISVASVVDGNGIGTVVVRWGDGVANEWEETFNSVSVALVRVAALAKCAEDGFESGFAQQGRDFDVVAEAMLRGLVC